MKQRLGHYDIVSELGRGGMGVVYKGYEASLNRYVAIKVLADALAHDEGVKERFLREARSMAALNDPHIIQIYFIGDDAGQTYFVMEFVEGESLSSMLKREHKLAVGPAAKIIHQTALGLATAHDHGVIHRDIKPGNLMITSRGSVKIADFGIALSNQDMSKKLTSTGEFVGTPGYLSPEVCLGKPVDQRSDIFSLGIVLFEMLAGRMPFTDESPLGLMLEVVRAEIPDVRQLNNDVDEQIAWILSRMIAKEPVDRYQSCHELAADLANHPLVAKGGPITLVPKMSTAASTMIGAKTPMPAAASLPTTSPTPMRVADLAAAPPPMPAATAPSSLAGGPPPPPQMRPSVLERDAGNAGKSSAALPIAIAAAALLALAGSAWAFRDRIPMLAAFVGSPQSAMPSDPSSLTQHDPAEHLGTPPPAQPPVDGVDANRQTVPQAFEASHDTAQGVQFASNGTDGAYAGNGSPLPNGTDPNVGPNGSDTSPPVEAPVQLPEPTATPARTEIARVTPPERPAAPPKPRVPTVAVIAGGDDVISEPARDALIEVLTRRGFRVIEGGRSSGGTPNLRAMSGKADAVLVVQARPVGTQQLTYYGQSSTLYTVQLGVKAYKVADGSVLWTSRNEQVNFTTLNAAAKAQEAIDPMLDAVEQNLDEFRPRRGGRG